MDLDPPAATPARYRILSKAFAHAFAARFGDLARSRAAVALGVSVPTLRKLLRADGVVNEATVARLERALRVPRLAFATVAAPARSIVPAITALPACRVDATLRAFEASPLLAAFFAQMGHHIHWRAHIADPARPYRQALRAAEGAAGGGYARFVVEAVALPVELALSFSVRGRGVDLAVDYGLLRAEAGRCRSWELIGRHGATAACRGTSFSFLTWLGGADDEVIVRSDRPCTIRLAEVLGRDEGERRLAADVAPAIGFRAMGYFHVAPAPPWADEVASAA